MSWQFFDLEALVDTEQDVDIVGGVEDYVGLVLLVVDLGDELGDGVVFILSLSRAGVSDEEQKCYGSGGEAHGSDGPTYAAFSLDGELFFLLSGLQAFHHGVDYIDLERALR